jgi:hypothetical protein
VFSDGAPQSPQWPKVKTMSVEEQLNALPKIWVEVQGEEPNYTYKCVQCSYVNEYKETTIRHFYANHVADSLKDQVFNIQKVNIKDYGITVTLVLCSICKWSTDSRNSPSVASHFYHSHVNPAVRYLGNPLIRRILERLKILSEEELKQVLDYVNSLG